MEEAHEIWHNKSIAKDSQAQTFLNAPYSSVTLKKRYYTIFFFDFLLAFKCLKWFALFTCWAEVNINPTEKF